MTKHLTWEGSKFGAWRSGKLGDQVLFVVTPWDADSRDGFQLKVLLPGYGAEAMWPLESLEAAQERSEDILKEWLKKTGLQFKPAPKKPKPTPRAVQRVEEFVAARTASRGSTPPYTDLKLADLEALVKLARKA
ncbi:hypothetical protein ACWDTT_15745 [Streptosporangium sandarakinum]